MSKDRQKKIKQVKRIVKKYVNELIKDDFPVQKAYIFGSYARGDFKKISDIDVCIISPRFRRNWDKNERYLWVKTVSIDSNIEPIGYSPEGFKDDVVLADIIREEGIRVV